MSKTAVIIGSTGLTGSYLVQNLLNSTEYEKIISFVRKSTDILHPKLVEYIIDFDNPDSYKNLIEGDDFFCCMGTTIKKAGSQKVFRKIDLTYPVKFAQLASNAGMKQYLIITAIGANAESGNFYMRTKGECEKQLRDIAIPSVSVFRPSLLLGNRQEFRLKEKLSEYLMKIVSAFFVGKLKKYKAIEAKKVAFAMYAVAQQHTRGYSVYESDKISAISELNK